VNFLILRNCWLPEHRKLLHSNVLDSRIISAIQFANIDDPLFTNSCYLIATWHCKDARGMRCLALPNAVALLCQMHHLVI